MSAALTEEDERVTFRETPFLSHSRVNRYLLCPEQYRLYYVERLRPRFPPANLVFGQAVHQALAHLFQNRGDPVARFQEIWRAVAEIDLDYGARESWEKLRDSGERLLAKFVQEELPKLGKVRAVEKSFTLEITSLDLPLVGILDLVVDLDAKTTVVDFKTSGSSYQEHEVVLSDQLTAYRLAEPEAEQAALCVLVKTKEPRIEWHVATRTGKQLGEYLAKVGYVGREIQSGRFYKRPGKWCGWCDYLPVCLGDQRRIRETLIQVR